MKTAVEKEQERIIKALTQKVQTARRERDVFRNLANDYEADFKEAEEARERAAKFAKHSNTSKTTYRETLKAQIADLKVENEGLREENLGLVIENDELRTKLGLVSNQCLSDEHDGMKGVLV